MKSSVLALGAALLIGLLLGGASGFMIGRGGPGAFEKKGAAAAGAVPPAPVIALGGARGAGRGPGSKTGPTATINLSGLPPAEAWRRLMDLRDPVAKADAVRLLLDSMPPAEWPIWLAKMIDSFKNEDIDDQDPAMMGALFGTLDALMQQMVATHPRECLAAMLSVDKKHSHGDDLVGAMMSTWARQDPQAARQFYEKEIAGRNHGKADDIAKSLVREMAKTDPKGTLDWAARLTDDRARGRGVMMAFETILKADRNEAITLLTSRPDLPERSQLAEQIAWRWAKSDPQQALEWAQTLPADLRGAAARRAFEGLGPDFNAARAVFDASAPDTKSLLLPALVQRAPKEQISAMAELLGREPITPGRAEASQTLMRQWVDQDPTAATGWLAQQPTGEVQDRAIVGFLGWADGYEPQAALEWAGTISDPQLRSRHLESLAKRFSSSDPAMARSWANGTTRLTPEERVRFFELTGKP